MYKNITPIRKMRLSHNVSETLIEMIRSGQLKAGTRLLSERELADAFEVSRTVVREAQQELGKKGYIKKEGRAWVVCSLSFNILLSGAGDTKGFIPDRKTVIELMDIRKMMESYIVRQAASHHTAESIVHAQQAINRMRHYFSKGSISYEDEVAFHESLAEMTDNQSLKELYTFHRNLLSEVSHVSLLLSAGHGINITAMDEHQGILDAISAKNADLAAERLQAHLDLSLQNILTVFDVMNRKELNEKS